MSTVTSRAIVARWRSRLTVRRGLLAYAQRQYSYWYRRWRKSVEQNLSREERARRHEKVEDRRAKRDMRREQVAYAERVIARHSGRPPRVITAAQLGLSFQWVFGQRGAPTRATGHYTAGPRARDAAEGIATVRALHAQHRGQGWGGGSYDAVICDDGTLILVNPPGRKSAHVAGNNTGNAAVNCPGTTGDEPTVAQQATFRWYLANAHTSRVPKAHRQPRDLRQVRWFGHNDLNATACPGRFKTMFTSKGARR